MTAATLMRAMFIFLPAFCTLGAVFPPTSAHVAVADDVAKDGSDANLGTEASPFGIHLSTGINFNGMINRRVHSTGLSGVGHGFYIKGHDNGVTLPGVTYDFEGTKRPTGLAYDIGADELVAGGLDFMRGPWLAGSPLRPHPPGGLPPPALSTSGRIPPEACFVFDSKQIDSNEVAQWNDQIGTAPVSKPNRFMIPDSGNARSKIRNGVDGNPCRLTPSGQISCIRSASQGSGASAAHTMFAVSGTCDAINGAWLKDGPYQYGAAVCLPPGAMNWVQATDWTIINQLHGLSGINPAFSIFIKKGNFDLTIRGDERTPAQIKSNGGQKRKYQSSETVNLGKIAGDNRCYNFEVALDWGSNGGARVWMDGKQVYSKSGLLIGYGGRTPASPQWGLYTYRLNGTQELIFDKIWFK
jgi:hypothetical protein